MRYFLIYTKKSNKNITENNIDFSSNIIVNAGMSLWNFMPLINVLKILCDGYYLLASTLIILEFTLICLGSTFPLCALNLFIGFFAAELRIFYLHISKFNLGDISFKGDANLHSVCNKSKCNKPVDQ